MIVKVKQQIKDSNRRKILKKSLIATITLLLVIVVGISIISQDDGRSINEIAYDDYLRTSLIKEDFLGNKQDISRQDFLSYARIFINSFKNNPDLKNIEVSIKVYEDPPYFTSFLTFPEKGGDVKYYEKQNEKTRSSISSLSELPEGNFSNIGFVRVSVFADIDWHGNPPPVRTDTIHNMLGAWGKEVKIYPDKQVSGWISYGRLKSSRIILKANGNQVVEVLTARMFPSGNLPNNFVLGDGMEHNYNYYIPISVQSEFGPIPTD